MAFWNQKTFCLITGASKGIGKTIAIEFSKNVAPGSIFLLLARSANALEETKAEMTKVGKSVIVATCSMDLSKPDKDAYLNTITSTLEQNGAAAQDFNNVLLVHNAGSLGIQGQKTVIQVDDLDHIQKYYSFNLFSLIILTSQFFSVFNDSSKERTIVQISSLGALQPFKTWGLYCAGKAARDMLMKSIASETGIHTLNWAPGPVQTDIYDEAVNDTGDEELRKHFEEARKAGNILTAEQTIQKLVRVLSERKYINGEHVDYYDVE